MDIKHDTDSYGAPVATAVIRNQYVSIFKDIGFTDEGAEHALKRMAQEMDKAYAEGWADGTKAQCDALETALKPIGCR
jgi:hypothetical protein